VRVILYHRSQLTDIKSFLYLVTLVNKDQLEILATLRESVNEDKAELEAETSRLQSQLKDLADKNRMQLEQINGLLLEKVTLQSDSIGQREKMLQRERDIGCVGYYARSFLFPADRGCTGNSAHPSWDGTFQKTLSHVYSTHTRRLCSFRSRSNL
jgi:hypothetical protein